MANDTFTGGFSAGDILYEDNHLIAVNKRAGQLVQSDTAGEPGLEEMIKAFIKERDGKPGEVFLGVAHRIDRPVSGAVLFAKTSKALVRLNEMLRDRSVKKIYWAITENIPEEPEGTLRHWMTRDGKTNRAHAYASPRGDAKEAVLRYRLLGGSKNYRLLEVELITGRHHQIRCQLAKSRVSDKGRPEVRCTALQPRRRHLAPFAQPLLRPSRTQGTADDNRSRPERGQPLEFL